ncbi:hypothetical protein BKA81DRAFT_381408 [Phyllosticta paracitricarpa]
MAIMVRRAAVSAARSKLLPGGATSSLRAAAASFTRSTSTSTSRTSDCGADRHQKRNSSDDTNAACLQTRLAFITAPRDKKTTFAAGASQSRHCHSSSSAIVAEEAPAPTNQLHRPATALPVPVPRRHLTKDLVLFITRDISSACVNYHHHYLNSYRRHTVQSRLFHASSSTAMASATSFYDFKPLDSESLLPFLLLSSSTRCPSWPVFYLLLLVCQRARGLRALCNAQSHGHSGDGTVGEERSESPRSQLLPAWTTARQAQHESR